MTRWVSGHPDRAAHLDALRRAPSGSPQPPSFDVGTFWTAVQARTTAVPAPVARRMRGVATPPPSWSRGVGARAGHRWLPGAVAVGLVLMVGALAVWRQAVRQEAPAFVRTYATAAAERATVALEDGTQVVIAPGSRVQLLADYGRGRRDVYLNGQAYFAVAHDPQHPFTVRAANAVARDVGTRFGVRAYSEEARVRVVVAEGSVSVGDTVSSRRTRHPVVGANTLAEVDRTGATVVTADVNTDAYLSWIGGRLNFRDTPLRDALGELGRWYDLDFRLVTPAPDGVALTATFGNEPVADALTALAVALNVRVRRDGRTVTLTPLPHDN